MQTLSTVQLCRGSRVHQRARLAHLYSYSSIAVRVTLRVHPNVSLMPSHHPASLPIGKSEIKSLVEHLGAILLQS